MSCHRQRVPAALEERPRTMGRIIRYLASMLPFPLGVRVLPFID